MSKYEDFSHIPIGYWIKSLANIDAFTTKNKWYKRIANKCPLSNYYLFNHYFYKNNMGSEQFSTDKNLWDIDNPLPYNPEECNLFIY